MRAATVFIIGALAARAVYVVWQYYFAAGPRHRVESAMIALIVLGLLSFVFRQETDRHDESRVDHVPRAWLVLMLAGSVALYGRAMSLGLLSDDYGLVFMAQSDSLGTDIGWLFRPLPLLLWRVILALGDAPITLHLLNVFLHGLNAFLVAVIGAAMGMRRDVALLGAALFLCFPAVPEAVAWAAGVQDLLMTTMALGAVALSGSGTPSIRRTALTCGLLILGLCSKETAVCIPMLVAVCWLSRERVKQDAGLYAAMAVVTAVYLAIRLPMGVGDGYLAEPTRYLFTKMITGAFATLAAPWRVPSTTADRVLAFAAVGLLLGLVVHACLTWHRSDRALHRVVRCGLWVLISIAPVYSLFFIGPNLEGARYVYLAAGAWALILADLIAAAADRFGRRSLVVGRTVAVIVVAVYVVSVQWEVGAWRQAAELRDRVLADARLAIRAAGCQRPAFTRVPDSFNGAYVFRNNFGEALDRALGRPRGHALVLEQRGEADCAFTWTGDRFIRSR